MYLVTISEITPKAMQNTKLGRRCYLFSLVEGAGRGQGVELKDEWKYSFGYVQEEARCREKLKIKGLKPV